MMSRSARNLPFRFPNVFSEGIYTLRDEVDVDYIH